MGTAIVTPLASEAFYAIATDPAAWARGRELADALYREFAAAVRGPENGHASIEVAVPPFAISPEVSVAK